MTARAVASTADLVELAFPLLARGGALVAWKRGDLDGGAGRGARASRWPLGGGTLDVLEVAVAGPDRSTGWSSPSGPATVPDGYPRDPAARRRDPW